MYLLHILLATLMSALSQHSHYHAFDSVGGGMAVPSDSVGGGMNAMAPQDSVGGGM